MGKVVQEVGLANVYEPARSRRVRAVIDTGATMLVLPSDLVAELGLRRFRDVKVRYSNNSTEMRAVFGIVELELLGRTGHFDVLAEEPGTQPLVGQIVLEELDLVVDPKGRCVLPNPQSPEVPLVEIL